MDEKILKLSSILKNINNYPWNYGLYLKGGYPWNSESLGVILNINELDPEDDPEFAKKNNMKYALNVQSVQDIVEGAISQKKNVSIEELIEAFNYYYKNDAFINLVVR